MGSPILDITDFNLGSFVVVSSPLHCVKLITFAVSNIHLVIYLCIIIYIWYQTLPKVKETNPNI